jgi:MFS transporter, DHA1 family, multidrug resistance protein
MAGSAGMVIAWRIVQACGACAGVVLSRAMVRDLYGADKSG